MKYVTIKGFNNYVGAMATRNIHEAFLDDLTKALAKPDYDATFVDIQCGRYQQITGNLVWIEAEDNFWAVTIYEDTDTKKVVEFRYIRRFI